MMEISARDILFKKKNLMKNPAKTLRKPAVHQEVPKDL